MKKVKISLILNAVNFLIISFAVVAMMTGFKFMGYDIELVGEGYSVFQFFTVDSNLLMGAVSLLIVIANIKMLKNPKNNQKLPKYLYLLGLASTASVSLTMFTTLFFLAPTSKYGFWSLFLNSNLIMHLIAPLISIISFLFFQKGENIKKSEALYGVIPMVLYGVYYVINVLSHMENGQVSMKYDFYGFAQGGVLSIVLSIIIMLIVTYLINLGLLVLNKKIVSLK